MVTLPFATRFVQFVDLTGARQHFVMNVTGRGKLVHLISPEEYLFGKTAEGSEQGGVYRRAFRGFRIENVPNHNVQAMHEFFLQTQQRNAVGEAKYAALWGNTFPYLNRMSTCEHGNCSYWTSQGMKVAETMRRTSMWPKVVFVRLYAELVQAAWRRPDCNAFFDPKNVSIVAYRKAGRRPADDLANSWVAPTWLLSWQSRVFRPLERFADIVVVTPAQPSHSTDSWLSALQCNVTPFRPFFPPR